MAFLTMEVEAFAGGSEESRFPPCFLWVHAPSKLVSASSLKCAERP